MEQTVVWEVLVGGILTAVKTIPEEHASTLALCMHVVMEFPKRALNKTAL